MAVVDEIFELILHVAGNDPPIHEERDHSSGSLSTVEQGRIREGSAVRHTSRPCESRGLENRPSAELANARRTNLHLDAFDFQGVTVDPTRDSHFVTYVILNFGLVANTDLRIKPDWSKLDDAELA